MNTNPFTDDDGTDGTLRRNLERLKRHSRSFKTADLQPLTGPALRLIGDHLRKEARENLANCGELFAFSHRDDAGRKITRFEGDIATWMAPFSIPPIPLKINPHPDQREETVKLNSDEKIQIVKK